MKKISLILPIVFFSLFPTSAFAVSYEYTCSDWTFEGSANCTSDIVNSGGSGGAYDAPPNFHLNTDTWYLSYILTDGDVQVNCAGSGCTGSGTGTKSPGTYTDEEIISPSDQGIYFHNANAWELSSICITDTIGGCTPTSTPSTGTTTTVSIDIDPLIIMLSVFLWITVFGFVFYVIRKLRNNERKRS